MWIWAAQWLNANTKYHKIHTNHKVRKNPTRIIQNCISIYWTMRREGKRVQCEFAIRTMANPYIAQSISLDFCWYLILKNI